MVNTFVVARSDARKSVLLLFRVSQEKKVSSYLRFNMLLPSLCIIISMYVKMLEPK